MWYIDTFLMMLSVTLTVSGIGVSWWVLRPSNDNMPLKRLNWILVWVTCLSVVLSAGITWAMGKYTGVL
jgi:hypothetical protein